LTWRFHVRAGELHRGVVLVVADIRCRGGGSALPMKALRRRC